jgi:UPF0755 protein
MTKKSKYIRIAILLIGFLVASFSYVVYQYFYTANLQVEKDKSFTLYIPQGANYDQVMDSLMKNKVINHDLSFRFMARWLKYKNLIKPGRYVIKPNSGNYNTIVKLRSGNQDPINLTFNNIRLRKDLVPKIGSKFEFDSTAFKTMLMDTSLAAKYGFTNENFMCMFIPNTYDIFWNVKPKEIFARMNKEYTRFWNEERIQKAKALNMSPVEVSILASIVEEEQARKEDEKPMVAGLYLNRLRLGMQLQADPTVKFAVGDFGIKRVLNKHLAVQSPYNTYINKGLPPGPIRLANIKSIDAVLNHAKHDYLYMCASPELNGYHKFAKTGAEHAINAKLYQDALNKLHIYK